MLAGVLYVAAGSAPRCSASPTSRTPASGRALLREDPLQLLPQAVPRVRGRRRRPGRRSSRSPPAPTSRTSCRDGIEEAAARTATVGAAAGRRLRVAAAARAPNALGALDDQIMVLVRRAIDQDVNLFDRSAAAGDERSATCSRRSCCRRARRATSTAHRARSAADLRRRRRGRRASPLSARRRAGARRRTRRHRHRAADAAAAGDRAADRRARSARAVRRRAVHACSAPRSATGWPSGSPIRSTG